mmetsp:Transcript_70951/g.169924  ORF Transcript_70951/g.169924 Transcript_70951/m.169924 type:complete len:869 (-) Transcript_70951:216-2822(-)
MRIFVNNVDGYIAGAICADLNKLSPTIIGTRKSRSNDTMPPMVKRVVPRVEVREMMRIIASCDVVIFDMHEADLEELEMLLRVLYTSELAHELVFILISSVGVWSRTPRDYEEVPKPVPKKEPPPPPEPVEPTPPVPAAKEKAKGKDAKDKGKDAAKEKVEEPPPPPVEEPPEEEVPPEMMSRPCALRSEDYVRRVPAPKFLEWKLIETQVLALGEKQGITPYVLSTGLPYGNGEEPLLGLFRAAWLGLDSLRLIGDGTNFVPCIHVRDVARCVRHVVLERPELPYHLCVDRSDITQKQLVEGVAGFFLDEKSVTSVHPGEACLAELGDMLTMDLRLEPSSLMPPTPVPEPPPPEDPEAGAAAEEGAAGTAVPAAPGKPDSASKEPAPTKQEAAKQDAAKHDVAKPDASKPEEAAKAEGDPAEAQPPEGEAPVEPAGPPFHWWCEEGIVANIEKVATELSQWRQLSKMRICIVGPPGSRANLLGAALAERYSLPHLNYEALLETQRQAQTSLGQELRDKEAEVTAILNNPKSQHPPFLPHSLTTQVVNHALQSKTVQSRGFVLSGYPETMEEANELFKEPGQAAPPLPTMDHKPQKDQGKGKEKEGKSASKETKEAKEAREAKEAAEAAAKEAKEAQERADAEENIANRNPLWPDVMVHLSSSDANCLQRFQEDRPGASELEFKKKMDRWTKQNPEDHHVAGCFCHWMAEKSGAPIVTFNIDSSEFDDQMDRVVEEVDVRVPVISNFCPPPPPRAKRESIQEAEEDLEALKRKSLEMEEQRRRKEKEEQLEQIKQEEAVRLEKHSEPLRQYLTTFVVPALTSALVEVCREVPEDPIGYLSDFLRAGAQEGLQVPLLGNLKPVVDPSAS